jgi:hypothetical protein
MIMDYAHAKSFADGLDLADQEDRVTFRTRIAMHSRPLVFRFLQEIAAEATGKPAPRSEHACVRVICDAIIAEKTKEA